VCIKNIKSLFDLSFLVEALKFLLKFLKTASLKI